MNLILSRLISELSRGHSFRWRGGMYAVSVWIPIFLALLSVFVAYMSWRTSEQSQSFIEIARKNDIAARLEVLPDPVIVDSPEVLKVQLQNTGKGIAYNVSAVVLIGDEPVDSRIIRYFIPLGDTIDRKNEYTVSELFGGGSHGKDYILAGEAVTFSIARHKLTAEQLQRSVFTFVFDYCNADQDQLRSITKLPLAGKKSAIFVVDSGFVNTICNHARKVKAFQSITLENDNANVGL